MDKKQRERAFLDEIRNIDSRFPKGRIIDSESPDFITNLGQGTLGIEIVEYRRGQNSGESSLRRSEVIHQRIADTAKAKFYETKDDPLWVTFSWHGHWIPKKSKTTRLGELAARAIESHIPSRSLEEIVIPNEYFEGSLLEKYLSSISVRRTKNAGQILWSSIEVGFISIIPTELQEIIRSKNTKIEQYQTKCNLIWLIIVADGKHISSTASLEIEALRYQYETKFDRVIFYDHQDHQARDLLISINSQK